MSVNTSRLAVKAPFHLEATARVLQRRARNPVDRWDGTWWTGSVESGGRPVVVRVRNAGSVDAPDVRLEADGQEEVSSRVRERLGLDVDPAPLARAVEVLPGAETLMARLRGLRPPCYGSLYEALVSVIPFQQVSLEAGITFFERLVRRYGHRLEADGDECFALPARERLARAGINDLRTLGLSTAKARALIGCAEAVPSFDETWLRTAPLAEALVKLRALPGIGPWSAHLVMLRGFGRLDSFPPGDSGVARSLTLLTNRPVTQADALALAGRLPGSAGWLYYLSLASQLVAKGLLT